MANYLYRAMAVCISLMMGRVGSVVGASVGGFLLDRQCESAFLASGISLISKFLTLHQLIDILKMPSLFHSVCGILSFFIPNIHQRARKQMAPRLSISSRAGMQWEWNKMSADLFFLNESRRVIWEKVLLTNLNHWKQFLTARAYTVLRRYSNMWMNYNGIHNMSVRSHFSSFP